jgi:Na+-driven multidrug efflux pump
VVLLILVPSFGAIGAAWAFVAVNVVGAICALALTRKALNLAPIALLRPAREDFRHFRQEVLALWRKRAQP